MTTRPSVCCEKKRREKAIDSLTRLSTWTRPARERPINVPSTDNCESLLDCARRILICRHGSINVTNPLILSNYIF